MKKRIHMRRIRTSTIAMRGYFTISLTLLILGSCFVNQDTVASEISRNYEVTFYNTETWPLSFQDYLRFELVYGDHKLDRLETKYIVNSIFPSNGKIESDKFTYIIQSMAALLTVLPSEPNVVEACISIIKSRTDYTSEQVKEFLDKELSKNRAEIDSVKPLCQEIISKGGNIEVKHADSEGCLFYQLLRTQGITTAIYSKLVTSNQLDILFALESLKPLKEPDEYVFSLADIILKDFTQLEKERRLTGLDDVRASWILTEEKRKLAELSEYMSFSGGNKLIEMLFNTIPHFVDNKGNTNYKESTPSPNFTISTLAFVRGNINMRSKFLEAKSNDKLIDFFVTSMNVGKEKTDKSWLLFIYQPEIIPPLSKVYSSSNIPAGYSKNELKRVLSGVISYGEILPEQVPSLSAVKSMISPSAPSKAAENSSKMIRQAIGKQLSKDPDALTDEDYKKVEKLTLSEYGISDITLLAKLTNLKELSIMPSQVSDINALAALINLNKLTISGKELRNIEPILNLQNLQELILAGVQINDIYSLSKLTNLQTLSLNATQINDISDIANFTNLRSLGISATHGLDLELFSNLSNLRILGITSNQVINCEPLVKLTGLQILTLRCPQIKSIITLAKLTNLCELSIGSMSIKNEDVAQLKKELPNLIVKISYAR
jgi:hypothetical protein